MNLHEELTGIGFLFHSSSDRTGEGSYWKWQSHRVNTAIFVVEVIKYPDCWMVEILEYERPKERVQRFMSKDEPDEIIAYVKAVKRLIPDP